MSTDNLPERIYNVMGRWDGADELLDECKAEIERLTRFSVVVRSHCGDEYTNELWKISAEGDLS